MRKHEKKKLLRICSFVVEISHIRENEDAKRNSRKTGDDEVLFFMMMKFSARLASAF